MKFTALHSVHRAFDIVDHFPMFYNICVLFLIGCDQKRTECFFLSGSIVRQRKEKKNGNKIILTF